MTHKQREWLVVDEENEDGPRVVGRFVRSDEDAIIYLRPDGSRGIAPADCVSLRPFYGEER